MVRRFTVTTYEVRPRPHTRERAIDIYHRSAGSLTPCIPSCLHRHRASRSTTTSNTRGQTTPIMFKYVFIPANDSKPIELREGDKSGGLSDDELSKTAKRYFFQNSDKGTRAAALNDATPEQRKVLADQLREEVRAASSTSPYANQMAALDDDALISIMMCVSSRVSVGSLTFVFSIICRHRRLVLNPRSEIITGPLTTRKRAKSPPLPFRPH
jgi:hypothetical protein